MPDGKIIWHEHIQALLSSHVSRDAGVLRSTPICRSATDSDSDQSRLRAVEARPQSHLWHAPADQYEAFAADRASVLDL